MRLVIERIIGELDHHRIPSGGDYVIHSLKDQTAVIGFIIHVIHHVVITVHFRTCRKRCAFVRRVVLEQLCIITAHIIIADILKVSYFFPFGSLKYRISPGHIQVIIIPLTHDQIPCMVLSAAGGPGHIGTEHTQSL